MHHPENETKIFEFVYVGVPACVQAQRGCQRKTINVERPKVRLTSCTECTPTEKKSVAADTLHQHQGEPPIPIKNARIVRSGNFQSGVLASRRNPSQQASYSHLPRVKTTTKVRLTVVLVFPGADGARRWLSNGDKDLDGLVWGPPPVRAQDSVRDLLHDRVMRRICFR